MPIRLLMSIKSVYFSIYLSIKSDSTRFPIDKKLGAQTYTEKQNSKAEELDISRPRNPTILSNSILSFTHQERHSLSFFVNIGIHTQYQAHNHAPSQYHAYHFYYASFFSIQSNPYSIRLDSLLLTQFTFSFWSPSKWLSKPLAIILPNSRLTVIK